MRRPEASDDAGLVEAAGGSVVLVDGDRINLKLTDPLDRVVAEALLGDRDRPRSADGPTPTRTGGLAGAPSDTGDLPR